MENETQPYKNQSYAEYRGLTYERGEEMKKIVNDTFEELTAFDEEGTLISEIDFEDVVTKRVDPKNMTELRVMDRFMYFRIFSRFMDDEDYVVEDPE